MEFGAKEIMIALGLLVFIAIVLDIIRRIRVSRYENIRMPRRKQPHFETGNVDEYGSELPGGGARVVSYRETEEIEQVKQNVQKIREQKRTVLKTFDRSNVDSHDDPTAGTEAGQPSAKAPEKNDADQAEAKPEEQQAVPEVNDRQSKSQQSSSQHTKAQPSKVQSGTPTKYSPQGSLNLDQEDDQEISLVIAMHMKAQSGEMFSGDQLKQGLLESGMRYGAMKIFHRHADQSGAGPVMFSVANLIKPGTFDLNAMDEFVTPGVTFFFDAAEVEKPMECFELMLETAQGLASTLDGELKDEMRSDLTRQTIEHYRQKITDFLRAKRLGVS